MEAGLSPASWGVGLQSFRSEVAFAPSKPQPALAEEAYWKTLWELRGQCPVLTWISAQSTMQESLCSLLAANRISRDGGGLSGGRSTWLMLESVLVS